MTPSPRLWIATFVTLLLLIGGLAGVVVDRLWLLPAPAAGGPGFGGGRGPGPGRSGGPGMMMSPARVMADLDEQLRLSAEQEAAIRTILDAWTPRIDELQAATRSQFIKAQRELRQEIAAALTPEQREAFERMGPGPLEGGPRGGPARRGGRGGR